MVPGYYRPGLAIALGLLMLVVSILTLQPTASAQCGVECWETPTPPPTATDFVPGTGTPTPVEMPATVVFGDVDYENPTSIPLPEFPDIPNPDQGIQLMPFVMPSPFSPSTTVEPFQTPALAAPTTASLDSISSTIPLSYTAPLTLSAAITVTDTFSGIISDGEWWVGELVSYTNYVSGLAADINPTGTITITAAPDWYAPELPREMADIGWTFEELYQGNERFSTAEWAWFVGYMASMPFQLIKILWELVLFAGPLGLVMAWLFVMLPFVALIKYWIFVKNLMVWLLNAAIRIIEIAGGWIPTGG